MRTLPRTLALALITVYQCTLSRLLPPACRFWPTCSRYAYEAIERYGVWPGRLARALPARPLPPVQSGWLRPRSMRTRRPAQGGLLAENPFDIFLPVLVPFVMLLEEGLTPDRDFTGSGGLAIIIFTISLKLVLTPLSLMQTKSMKAMQAIQPEIAALKKKYPKDRERHGPGADAPLQGVRRQPGRRLLPMIPMMIVLIGLYQALIHLSCDPVTAATRRCDPHPQRRALRPRLLALDQPASAPRHPVPHRHASRSPASCRSRCWSTQFAYGKLTPTAGASDDPQQQMMQRMTTYFMPLMLFFFSFNFPAGLVLYWTISNIFEIVPDGRHGWLGPPQAEEPSWPASAAPRLSRSPQRRHVAQKRPSVPRDGEEPDEPVNPPPGRPPGGGRKKKGKRGGKR